MYGVSVRDYGLVGYMLKVLQVMTKLGSPSLILWNQHIRFSSTEPQNLPPESLTKDMALIKIAV